MNIQEVFAEWEKDCRIDKSQLDDESINIPRLHNKYIKMYAIERVRLKELNVSYNETKRKLIKYYRGEMDKNELQDIGRPQFLSRATGKEFEMLVETDDLMTKQVLKLAAQEEKVEFIKSVVASINRRSFDIKNAIDFMKWSQGA